MDIRVGYRIEIGTIQATPGILLLDPHPSRQPDFVTGPNARAASVVVRRQRS